MENVLSKLSLYGILPTVLIGYILYISVKHITYRAVNRCRYFSKKDCCRFYYWFGFS